MKTVWYSFAALVLSIILVVVLVTTTKTATREEVESDAKDSAVPSPTIPAEPLPTLWTSPLVAGKTSLQGVTYITFAGGDERYMYCVRKQFEWLQELYCHFSFYVYTLRDLDADFTHENVFILNQRRGCGYWLWKPYVIKKALQTLANGQILVYSDACSRPADVPRLMEAAKQYGMAGTQSDCPQYAYAKRDAFVLMRAEDQFHDDTLKQRYATTMAFEVNPTTRQLVGDWLLFGCDPRIITDQPNEMGQPNHDIFVENRHDQTIFSILTHRYQIGSFTDENLVHHAFG